METTYSKAYDAALNRNRIMTWWSADAQASAARKSAAYELAPGATLKVTDGPHAGAVVTIITESNAGFNGMSFWCQDLNTAEHYNVYGSQVEPF